ncbi:5045_t:CDS:2 [Racocetra persica]|uniref:5045_t:CDS:1 n=1 Tax=Racocetra persica TaxID=160502 RepID=A0ACA9L4Y0_9GLOM|nr:5045_t:CDS:2 [Racocetra persica]
MKVFSNTPKKESMMATYPELKKYQPVRKAPNKVKQQLDDINDTRHQSTEQDTPNSKKKGHQLTKEALNWMTPMTNLLP